jgi:imidazolonepropionase-like amidohydrolase
VSITVLKAARLFTGHKLQTPGILVIKADRIVSMTAGDASQQASLFDLGDATLMPGLIDCHTHVSAFVVQSRYIVERFEMFRSADNVPEAALYGLRNTRALLRNGFTTIRDVGGYAGIDIALRDAFANGALIGPRMLASGRALTITGGHADRNDLPDWVHVDPCNNIGVTASGPYGFRQIVREQVKRHVDWIKVVATGGLLSWGDAWDVRQLNRDETEAVVDEAQKFGLEVAAHAHGEAGITMAVEAGVRSIEHGTGVSEKTLAVMVERGTTLVPALWAIDSILQPGNPNRWTAQTLEKAQLAQEARNEGMQRALASGVNIAYGTDAGVFPHTENNKDFAAMGALGMPPIDVLRTATANAAELIGRSDRGTLVPGKLADVVAFAGNPLDDINLMAKPPIFVMLGGRALGLRELGD